MTMQLNVRNEDLTRTLEVVDVDVTQDGEQHDAGVAHLAPGEETTVHVWDNRHVLLREGAVEAQADVGPSDEDASTVAAEAAG